MHVYAYANPHKIADEEDTTKHDPTFTLIR